MILEQVELDNQATVALAHVVSSTGVKSNEDCVEMINKIISRALFHYEIDNLNSIPSIPTIKDDDTKKRNKVELPF